MEVAESTTAPPAASVPLQPGLFEAGADGALRLVGTRCRQCGARFFPRRAVCARCLSPDTEVVPLSSRGTLYTYTVVYQSTPEFRTPYLLAYVDLPEGVRLLAPLEGLAPDQVQIGIALDLRVEAVRRDAEGRAVIGYRLYPAAEVTHE